jgi:hypothetical protein
VDAPGFSGTIRLNLRAVTRLSAAFGLALTFASLPAAAQQWTPKQRAACEPDAMRLCNHYIPDVQRVSACMSAYRRYRVGGNGKGRGLDAR